MCNGTSTPQHEVAARVVDLPAKERQTFLIHVLVEDGNQGQEPPFAVADSPPLSLMREIASSQAAQYVSERTVRHHVSLQKSSQYRVTRTGGKYMEDMYCDNDYSNMTPTRCGVPITSESEDELISLRGQFFGRAALWTPWKAWTRLCGRS